MRHVQGFIEDVHRQAEWRADKFAQYPDDVRNANASKGLTDLAKFISVLPADSPILIRLDSALDNLYSGDSAFMEPSITDILGQFRFGRTILKNEGFEEFLLGIIETVERYTASDDAARERKLRRQLAKYGYALRKSRQRVPNIDNHGAYMIVDVQGNFIAGGERYNFTLDDIAEFLIGEETAAA